MALEAMEFSAAYSLEESLRGVVSNPSCAAFYVEATADPVRRWLGDADFDADAPAAPAARKERAPMPGHGREWCCMKVGGFFHGRDARDHEASLIAYGKELGGEMCLAQIQEVFYRRMF